MEFEGLLPNAPLLYVLGSVGFTPVLSIDSHIPHLQESLRSEYPLVEEMDFQHVSFQLENGQTKTITTTTKLWHFLSIDRSWAIAIENQKVILHTSNYTRFNEFADRFKRILTVLKDVLNLRHYLHQGIRYIDLVTPLDGESLSDYLPPEMLISHINGIAGQQMDGFSGASFVTDHGRLAVRCWMNPPQISPPDLTPLFTVLKLFPARPQNEFAILDTDHSPASENPSEFKVEAILAKLKAMHVTCRKVFEEIPKEHAFKIWNNPQKGSL